MNFKLFTILLLALLIMSLSANKNAKAKAIAVSTDSLIVAKQYTNAFNILIISDWGWNGKLAQKNVAKCMAHTAENIKMQFVVSCGDNFQWNGVQSVNDTLWQDNFENIYNQPTLMVNWYPVLGNHDYIGNTKAQIDYSTKSNRWKLLNQYYKISLSYKNS